MTWKDEQYHLQVRESQASGLPVLALPPLVFGLMSALLHREGRRREKEKEEIWTP